MAQAAGRRLSRTERTIVVVSVTLVVVFAVMLALRLGGSAAPADADTAATPPATSPPAADPTPSQTPTGAQSRVDLTTVTWDFVTPSGNIGCAIDDNRALCAIATMEYADQVPAAEQEGCDGQVGHVLQVTADGASLVCDSSGGVPPFEVDQVLEYGSEASEHGFTCLSDETGMTCRHDASGYSFSVARAGYDLT